MLRAIPLLSVLALLLSSPSQAALVSAAPASLPPATSENASTAFFEGGSESRIGLLCHNDPINRTDPMGLAPEWLHVALDAIGTVEPTPFADLTNAVLYGSEGNWKTAAISVAGVIPYVGDAGKLGKYGVKAEKALSEAKRFSKEKEALVDMAKADKRTGITPEDMKAYKELNKELRDPFPANKVRGPEQHASGGPQSQQPHGHVGPVDHIPVKKKKDGE